MITQIDVELLQGLIKKAPHAVKIEGDKVLLYSKWFALELPAAQMDPAFEDWDDEAHPVVLEWRKTIPPGDGEYAEGARWTNPDDGVKLIKLLSPSFNAVIHPSLYDLVMKKFPTPEFRLFDGVKSLVAIYSDGKLIGGVAQMKVEP